jgi:hypothetical protein
MHVIVACTFFILSALILAWLEMRRVIIQASLLDDSSYNIIHQLEKKADDVPWDASPSKT